MSQTTSLLFLLIAAASVLLAWVIWQRVKLRRTKRGVDRASDQLLNLWEMVNTSPEGLFFWDHRYQSTYCSSRLSKILGVAPNASIEDVMAAFSIKDSVHLEFDITRLRNQGIGFERQCNLNKRLAGTEGVRITGLRITSDQGAAVADILWMRPAESSPATEPADFDIDSLHQVLNAMPVAVWLRDDELNLTFANTACTGKQIPMGATDLAHKAREQGLTAQESQPLSAPKTGTLVISETPLPGVLEGTIGVAVEHQAPERDDKEEDIYRATLDHLSEGVVIFDEEQNIHYFNAAFADLWGLDRDWLRTQPSHGALLDKLHEGRNLPAMPDWAEHRADLLAQTSEITEPIEELLHIPDGRTVICVYAPVGGERMVRIDVDVSDQFDMQRSRNQAEAVRIATLNKVQEAVAVFGMDGRLALFNERFATLWGIEKETEDEPNDLHVSDFAEIMRQRSVGLSGLGDADWQDKKEQIVKRLTSREILDGQIILNNGTALQSRYVPLPDGASMVSFLDVTDSNRVEEALRNEARAFREADLLKSALIGDISHEIRTPLTTISGFAQILAGGLFGELNKRQRDYARGIVQTTEEMEVLLSNIMELAAIEAGKASLDLETIDLHSLLLTVFNLFRPTADRERIETHFDCPPDIGRIVADPRRLRQMVHGLLSHAVRFTPQNGRIVLGARNDEEFAEIHVTNSGSGIHRDLLKSAPYLRLVEVDPAESEHPISEQGPDTLESADLGLTLVSKFVQMHGGKIVVSSDPSEGTTVKCSLPYDQNRRQSELPL